MTLEMTRPSETYSVDVVFASLDPSATRGVDSAHDILDDPIVPIVAVAAALSAPLPPEEGALNLRVMGSGHETSSAASVLAARPRVIVVDGIARRLGAFRDPIPVELRPEEDRTLAGRLVTLRTPESGLGDVLDSLVALRRLNERISMHVVGTDAQGVLDSLPLGVKFVLVSQLDDVLSGLREARILFHPGVAHPEGETTWIALANGVGIPGLAHADGASVEAVSSSDQLLVHDDVKEIWARVGGWVFGPGRRRVELAESFRMGTVVEQWRAVIL